MAVMSVLVFVGIYMIGDPLAILVSPEATELDREAIARSLGLDRPMWEQYFTFVTSALQGNFGKSFVFGQPAINLILERMPATLELALIATVTPPAVIDEPARHGSANRAQSEQCNPHATDCASRESDATRASAVRGRHGAAMARR